MDEDFKKQILKQFEQLNKSIGKISFNSSMNNLKSPAEVIEVKPFKTNQDDFKEQMQEQERREYEDETLKLTRQQLKTIITQNRILIATLIVTAIISAVGVIIEIIKSF